MAPPKKDAFADLFQSATSSSNTPSKVTSLPLSERQRLQQSQQHSLSGSAHSSYSNLDALSGQTSRPSTPLQPKKVATASMNQRPDSPVGNTDPFAIFYKNTPVATTSQPNIIPNGKPSPRVANSSSQIPKIGELSLLDDEFTDVFQNTSPPQATVLQRPASTNIAPNNKPPPQQQQKQSKSPERPSSASSGRVSKNTRENRDFIIAELIDIGFPIEACNEAIDACGLDLQACVNYIMNNMSGRSTPAQNRSDNDVLGRRPEGIKFNEISSGLFKGANKLLNISRNTVMKNLEQFNGGGTNNNVPAWMKNQDKYKSEAIEKKVGGEDYGTDEDNINQEEIERFMRLQREKKQERYRQGTRSEQGVGKPGNGKMRSESPVAPPRPRRPASSIESPAPSLPARPKEPIVTSPSPVPVPAPAHTPTPAPTPDVDLLGMSSSIATANSGFTSSLRDKTPLNQFVETDYNTCKKKASDAFKSGDYTTSLEAYNICLDKLPPTHELRVIIFSNLGVVYKLSGHLKDSLQAIESGLKLIDENEVDSNNTIIGKSVKYWYIKLISVKAEVLELLERYELSLQFYTLLIQKLGSNDKKIMDGRRRVDKIVNPENHIKKQPRQPTPTRVAPTPTATPKPKVEEPEVDVLFKDKIDNKIQAWSTSKQNNLRAMLTNLDEIIPSKINMKPSLRKLTLNDLMLSKQVKIQYMKVISSIHPDKLASQCKGDKETELICNGVFITLNKRWEAFRKEESI
ncbi:UBA domain-containing protein 7 [Spathaspora sp. JA1]|nr:UBA domain-containing protein 7 [Spathaspora sp. JA1]